MKIQNEHTIIILLGLRCTTYELHPSGLVEKGEPRICASFFVLFESVICTPGLQPQFTCFFFFN